MPNISVRSLGGSPRDRFDHEQLRHEFNQECPDHLRIDPRAFSIPGSGWLNPAVGQSVRDPKLAWYVACADNQLAGQLRCDIVGPHVVVSELFVRKERRGARVGRSLLTVALNWADGKAEFATLSVECTNPAMDLYERLGFVVCKELNGEYCGSTYDYYLMSNRIECVLGMLRVYTDEHEGCN